MAELRELDKKASRFNGYVTTNHFYILHLFSVFYHLNHELLFSQKPFLKSLLMLILIWFGKNKPLS